MSDDKVDKVTLCFDDQEEAINFFNGISNLITQYGEKGNFTVPSLWEDRIQEIHISWGEKECLDKPILGKNDE